jgi:hypothetical protein
LELRKDSAGIISDIAASFLSSNSLKSQQCGLLMDFLLLNVNADLVQLFTLLVSLGKLR